MIVSILFFIGCLCGLAAYRGTPMFEKTEQDRIYEAYSKRFEYLCYFFLAAACILAYLK